MNRLSYRADGTAAEIVVGKKSRADLNLLFMKSDLYDFVPEAAYSKSDLVTGAIAAAQGAQTEQADAGLREFVRLVAEEVAPGAADGIVAGTPFWSLREAVRADGLDLVPTYEVTEDVFETWSRLVEVRLLPLDEPLAPLSTFATALQADFARLGMSSAANAYREALNCLGRGDYLAANGQMRAMYEAVVIYIATLKGFTSTKQGDGGNAIRYLIDQHHLRIPTANSVGKDDGGDYIRGLWSITHTDGPHPGATDAGEAHYRVQAMTSAARYLIDRFAPAP